MHILQITLRNTFTTTTTTIISHTAVSLLMCSFTKSQVWKIFFWLHFSYDKPSCSVQLLTPSSLLFMILMATFSPVRMCRPSLTLAKPPENTSHLVGERAKPLGWRGMLKRTGQYPNRWSHKPCSICGALRHRGSPSFA